MRAPGPISSFSPYGQPPVDLGVFALRRAKIQIAETRTPRPQQQINERKRFSAPARAFLRFPHYGRPFVDLEFFASDGVSRARASALTSSKPSPWTLIINRQSRQQDNNKARAINRFPIASPRDPDRCPPPAPPAPPGGAAGCTRTTRRPSRRRATGAVDDNRRRLRSSSRTALPPPPTKTGGQPPGRPGPRPARRRSACWWAAWSSPRATCCT